MPSSDDDAWQTHTAAVSRARTDSTCEIAVGGRSNGQRGYFVDTTLVVTTDHTTR